MGGECEEEGSVLGTQEHWDGAYKAELAEFRASGGSDAGEVWFGEDTQRTMVAFVGEQVDAREAAGGATSRAGWRVLDLGCGNGALCVALARAGFAQLLGVDYVGASIELSREVAAAAGVACARFQEDDVLHSALPAAAYDLVVDKGTFDAVGLRADGEKARAAYLDSVARLLPPGGLLVVTSCNSTADELRSEFCAGGRFEEVARVRTYPVFRFGGVEGTRVCTLAFTRTVL